MKFVMILFLLFATQYHAQAQIVYYNSQEFKDCMVIYDRSLDTSMATRSCEYLSRSNEISLFREGAFNKCVQLNDKSLDSHMAANNCVEYGKKNFLEVFLTKQFDTCFNLNDRSLDAHIAVSNCLESYKQGSLDLFSNNNYLQCVDYRDKSMDTHVAVDACLNEFKGVAAKQSLTLEQVNDNIQVPENTQIILKTAIEMPGKQSCVASKDGAREVKCWVCRVKESRNDVLYRVEKDEQTGLSQKILPVQEAKLSTDGKELHFPLVHDSSDSDNLSLIFCNSKKPFQIKNRSELLPILENNDLKLIIPAPKEK